MRDDPVTLWEEETEGWPYDGGQTLLRWSPGGGFVLEHTYRHIDADSERFERTPLPTGEALRRLRAAGRSLGVIAHYIAPLLETAAPVSEGVWELDGVLLRRSQHPPPPPSLLERLSQAIRGTPGDETPVVVWSWGPERP